MRRSIKLAALAVASIVAVAAQASEFQLTVTDLGPQPLSPVFYAASDSTFDEFDLGATASIGIKHIAEEGDPSFETAIAASSPGVGTYGVLGSAPIAPFQTVTTTFSADARHPYFSFAMMLGKTNDGFLGESYSSAGLMLFEDGKAQSWSDTILGLRAWDAGTEKDTQNKADLAFLGGTGNPPPAPADAHIHIHQGVIPGVGDSWQLMPQWTLTTEMAQVTLTPTPEPRALIPLALGLVGLIARRRKRG